MFKRPAIAIALGVFATSAIIGISSSSVSAGNFSFHVGVPFYGYPNTDVDRPKTRRSKLRANKQRTNNEKSRRSSRTPKLKR